MKSKGKPDSATPRKNRAPLKKGVASEVIASEQRDRVQDLLPSVEVLASIAAVVGKGRLAGPEFAVSYALRLWKCARAALGEELGEAATDKFHSEIEKELWDKLPPPPQDQPTFEQFLKLVVRAKTPADSTKRFRDYLRHNVSEGEAMSRIAELKGVGFGDVFAWLDEAGAYLDWWRGQRSELARIAAKKKRNEH